MPMSCRNRSGSGSRSSTSHGSCSASSRGGVGARRDRDRPRLDRLAARDVGRRVADHERVGAVRERERAAGDLGPLARADGEGAAEAEEAGEPVVGELRVRAGLRVAR